MESSFETQVKINGGKLLGHGDKKFNRAMQTDSTI